GMTGTAFIVGIQTNVSWKVRGSATASNMFMRSMGSALGVAFLGGVLNNIIQKEINHHEHVDVSVNQVDAILDPDNMTNVSSETMAILQGGLLNGMQYVFICMGIIALVSMFIILWIPKQDFR